MWGILSEFLRDELGELRGELMRFGRLICTNIFGLIYPEIFTLFSYFFFFLGGEGADLIVTTDFTTI